jgi:hypothetical protein
LVNNVTACIYSTTEAEGHLDSRDVLTECVKALAWPVATLAIAAMMRAPLAGLILFLRRVKYQDFEFEFEQGLSELSSKIGGERKSASIKPRLKQIETLALSHPNQAVVDAWREVESSLVEFARSRTLTAAPAAWVMPLVLAALLFNEGQLTDSQNEVIRRLKALRDRITHTPGFVISADEALKYVDVASRVVAMLADGGIATTSDVVSKHR